MDVNTLAVALISAGGVLGGTLGGAMLSQRAGRAQAAELNQRFKAPAAHARRVRPAARACAPVCAPLQPGRRPHAYGSG
ncbi:hypothetical protein ACFCYC_12625 [Streptomyces sp. NPDC056402]|uniref:hypothetical protein n=1 Tax=Streptomyces sp. NPDC056402 TaxID=3345810 RepID=UPI0035D6BB63